MSMKLPTLDLVINQQNLNSYLQQLVTLVNNQGEVINQLQKEIKQKTNYDHIGKMFKQISDSYDFNDSELRQKLKLEKKEGQMKLLGDIIEDNVNKISERNELQSMGWKYCLELNRDYIEEVKVVQKQIQEKVKKDYVKSKNKKAKKYAHDLTSDLERRIKIELENINKTNQIQIQNIDQHIKESEKRTIWKIEDCIQLLNKRVNQEYVDQSIVKVQNQISKEFALQIKENWQVLSDNCTDNNRKIKDQEEKTNEKIKALKKQQIEDQEKLRQQYVNNDLFEQNKKMNGVQLLEINRKIQELEKKGDSRELQTKVMDYVKLIEDKQVAMKSEHIQLRIKFDEFNKIFDQTEKARQKNVIDIHVICGMENDIKVIKQQLEDNKFYLQKTDQNLEIKYQILEKQMKDELRKIHAREDISIRLKDDFIQLSEKNNNKLIEEMGRVKKNLHQLQDNNTVILLEQRINQLEQKFDMNSLTDLINTKISQKDLNYGMSVIDKDINQVQNILHQHQKQLTSFNEFMINFQNHIHHLSLKEEVVSVFVKNNTVTKMRCVSCGINYPHDYKSDMMRGSDGRYYKSDQHEIGLNKGQEVYDITLHQAKNLIQAENQVNLSKSTINTNFYKQSQQQLQQHQQQESQQK